MVVFMPIADSQALSLTLDAEFDQAHAYLEDAVAQTVEPRT